MKHLLAVAPYHEGDEHTLALGCILKMYHSHTLSIDKLKKIFWASPPGEQSELSIQVLPECPASRILSSQLTIRLPTGLAPDLE